MEDTKKTIGSLSDTWLSQLPFPEEDTAAWLDETKAAEFDTYVSRRRRPYVMGLRIAVAAVMAGTLFVGVHLLTPKAAETAVVGTVASQNARLASAEREVEPSQVARADVEEPVATPVKVHRKAKAKPVPSVEEPAMTEPLNAVQKVLHEDLVAELPPAELQQVEFYAAELEQQKATHQRQMADRTARLERDVEMVLTLMHERERKVPAGSVIVQNS